MCVPERAAGRSCVRCPAVTSKSDHRPRGRARSGSAYCRSTDPGLDVGSIEYIHRRLIEQRDKGKAVLLVSLELDEVLNLSDRIAVINNGELVGIVKTSETNERELGLMMAGYQKEEAPHE